MPKTAAPPVGIYFFNQHFNSLKLEAAIRDLRDLTPRSGGDTEGKPKVLSSTIAGDDGPMHIAFGRRAPLPGDRPLTTGTPPMTAGGVSRPVTKVKCDEGFR